MKDQHHLPTCYKWKLDVIHAHLGWSYLCTRRLIIKACDNNPMWGNWSLHQSFCCEKRKGGTDGINISQENLTGLCDRLGIWDEGAGWNKCYFRVDICLVGPSSLSPWASHSLCKLCPVGKLKELWFSGSTCLPCPLVYFSIKGNKRWKEKHVILCPAPVASKSFTDITLWDPLLLRS